MVFENKILWITRGLKRERREKSGLGCLILSWVSTSLSSQGWDQISLIFGDGSDIHCRFVWNVTTCPPNCVSSPVGRLQS